MRCNLKLKWFSWFANVWLVTSIHFDAFFANPAAYLRAFKWLLLGKRVRARGQLAPLLGLSPKSYTYWTIRSQGTEQIQSPPNQSPPIVALINSVSTNVEALDKTLRSFAAEGLNAVVVTDLLTTLESINWLEQPWILPVEAGDQIAPGTAQAYRQAITATDAKVIYADDDVLDQWGRRTAPHLKPNWNSELQHHFDYLTGACIVSATKDELSRLANYSDWPTRLVANAVLRAGAFHICKVLHHRAVRPSPPARMQPLPIASRLPSVSIIIPTRNRLDLLQTCLEGVSQTDYPDLDVIVMDNDSNDPATLAYLAALDPQRIRVLRHGGQFNYSSINNRAASAARGELLCLLNNDIEVLTPDWLAIMATQALRSEVGAVGAQLLYPDGRIQHAGVVIGVGNAAGHAHRFIEPGAFGYFRRHALPQFTAAVTGACLVVAREKFLAVGGLDDRSFAVAYNDVDLCLRLNQRGWQSLYEPRAVLVHHESVSRGHDRDPVGAARFAGELAALKRIWRTDEIVDPYHHPQLSRASEQFVLAL